MDKKEKILYVIGDQTIEGDTDVFCKPQISDENYKQAQREKNYELSMALEKMPICKPIKWITREEAELLYPSKETSNEESEPPTMADYIVRDAINRGRYR